MPIFNDSDKHSFYIKMLSVVISTQHLNLEKTFIYRGYLLIEGSKSKEIMNTTLAYLYVRRKLNKTSVKTNFCQK